MTEPSKCQLRERYVELRRGISVEMAQAAAAAIVENFRQEPRFQSAAIIGGYMKVRSELELRPLLMALHKDGKRILLPVLNQEADTVSFREWQPGAALVKGPYGIPEPPLSAPELIPSLLLVPLLCFDANGHRVGYGGGYYDRALHKLRSAELGVLSAEENVIGTSSLHPLAATQHPALSTRHSFLAVGVAYAGQQTPTPIPAEPFDERLDAVITEQGVVWFNSSLRGA